MASIVLMVDIVLLWWTRQTNGKFTPLSASPLRALVM